MESRKAVLRQIRKLAQSRVNDAVRLAFLSEEELGELAKLDLSAVAEFKRNSNGTVEVKFIDRLAALQWLMDRAEEDPKAQRLYEALEGAAEQVGEEK
ncbi:MAG: XRE family transcriptional regulator [Pseudoflavonifractor sp.]|nr:XRE family transcriptional regulator [Pseudoflavonifractor sp.]